MMYYSQENKESAAKHLAEDYREAASLFVEIKSTIQEFDGKMFNKRFETALQNCTDKRIYCKRENAHWIIIYYYSLNMHQYITLAGHRVEDMTDGKRINAEKFLESGREHYTEHLQKAASLEAAIVKAPEIKKQISQLIKMINTLSAQVDCYEAREIFDLNYRITNY